MDAKFITQALTKCWIWRQSEDFAVNVYLKNFESDFISITKAGYMNEVEVKISRSDFKADFEKQYSIYDYKTGIRTYYTKHLAIKTGAYGLKTFSFATPKGLLNISDIPHYCGLYEIDDDGYVETIKAPPTLLCPIKIDANERASLRNYYKWRWRKLYFKAIK